MQSSSEPRGVEGNTAESSAIAHVALTVNKGPNMEVAGGETVETQPNDSVTSSNQPCNSTAAPRVPHQQEQTCVPQGDSAAAEEPGTLGQATCPAPSGVSQALAVPAQLGAVCALTPLPPSSFSASGMEALGASVAALSRPQAKGNAKKQSPSERLQRSRERNRMHARKTRQRKKEHVLILQNRAEELKQEQLRLRQLINEKNTANILVGLFSQGNSRTTEDPRVEQLLHRPVEDIPDSSKIPELPALILPGQHNSKKNKVPNASSVSKGDFPDDGIDYELLGKDRSQCTPEELDQIRRERNRMHAKRTRDRKRLFMEEMEEIIKKLEGENEVLKCHADKLNIDHVSCSESTTPSLASPTLKPASPSLLELPSNASDDQKHETVGSAEADQIKSLLAAAGAFDKSQSQNCTGMMTITSVASVVSATHSAAGSVSDEQLETLSDGSTSPRPNKRQRLDAAPSMLSAVPASIATIGS